MSPLGDVVVSIILLDPQTGGISHFPKHVTELEALLFGTPPSYPCVGQGQESGQPCRVVFWTGL